MRNKLISAPLVACLLATAASGQVLPCMSKDCPTNGVESQIDSLFDFQLSSNRFMYEQYLRGNNIVFDDQEEHLRCVQACADQAEDRREDCRVVYMREGQSDHSGYRMCLDAVGDNHFRCLNPGYLDCNSAR